MAELVFCVVDGEELHGKARDWWTRIANRYHQMTGEIMCIAGSYGKPVTVCPPVVKLIMS
jgi:hypothetical protein